MKFCPECGKQLEGSAGFCGACGKKLPKDSPATTSPVDAAGTSVASAAVLAQTKLDEGVAQPMRKLSSFSIVVKVACILILVAGFLPFFSVSCSGDSFGEIPELDFSSSGYSLASGAVVDNAVDAVLDALVADAVRHSQGGFGGGNPIIPTRAEIMEPLEPFSLSDPILITAFVGVLLLLIVSFISSRLELCLGLIVPTFMIAVLVYYAAIILVANSTISTMRDLDPFLFGQIEVSVSIGIGLYLALLTSATLLIAASVELLRRLRGN